MRSGLKSKRVALACCCLLAGAVPAPAWAQSSAQALLDNKFVFNLGGFVVNSDVTARLDGQSATNPDVDFDKTFGNAGDSTRVRFDALWRITPAHQLRYTFFDYSRDTSRVIDQDIKWGDYTFTVGGLVEAQRKFQVNALAYEWAFVRQPTYEVAASFGVHYTDLSLQLSGNATVTDANGNVTPVGVTVRSSSLPAPLPVIGLRGGWVLAPQWYLDADARLFKLNVDGYDGSWSDLGINGTWMFSRNFGVGLGYNRFYTNVDVDRDDFNGRLKYGYSGLRLFVTGTF